MGNFGDASWRLIYVVRILLGIVRAIEWEMRRDATPIIQQDGLITGIDNAHAQA